jgi:hypothetical protein
MPLFESTGVGRRQRSLKGMVLSRPSDWNGSGRF